LRIAVLALYNALLNFLDALANVLAVALFNFSVVELGVLNAVWTLVYILPVRVAGFMADRGLFKKMSFVSAFTTASSTALLALSITIRAKPLFYTAYTLHAIAYAFGLVSVNSCILEVYDSSLWKRATRRLATRVLLLEALIYLLASRAGLEWFTGNALVLVLTISAASVLYAISMPQPKLLIERTLYKLEKSFAKLLSSTPLSLYWIPLNPVEKTWILEKRFREGGVTATAALACLAVFRFSNEILFTPLPAVLYSQGLGFQSLLLVYGFARLLATVFVNLTPSNPATKGVVYTALLTRVLAATLLYSITVPASITPVPLSALIAANAALGIAIYSLYVEATYGYRTGTYMLVNELAGFAGSLLSGYMIRSAGPSAATYTVLASALTIAVVAGRV